MTRKIIDEIGFYRTITRLAHEIIERNKGAGNIAVIGIRTRGEYLAKRLADIIISIENKEINSIAKTPIIVKGFQFPSVVITNFTVEISYIHIIVCSFD